MNPERWARIQEIFTEALRVDDAQRPRFIRDQCGDDPELAREVESLIQHPASMTHASMGADARRRANISDGLVRLSVGIENVDDIIADLEHAMSVHGSLVDVPFTC